MLSEKKTWPNASPVSYTHLDVYKRQGGVGTGKTHLVTALGLKAALSGKEVRFFQTVDLANRLLEKNAKGTLGSFTRGLESCDLLIVDELGFLPLHRHAAELLFPVSYTHLDVYKRQAYTIPLSQSGTKPPESSPQLY